MKKILLTSMCAVALFSNAQLGVVYNGDLETWTSSTIFESLDNWNTSNQEWPGAGTCIKSTDAQDGSFSLELNTVLVDTDTAFGYAAWGEVGNDLVGNPYSTSVDSLVAYFKYDFTNNDSATVLAVQFTAAGPVLNMWKFAGSNTSTWERKAFKLLSPVQDSLLVAFASGNAFEEYSNPGSMLMVDNVMLTTGAGTGPNIGNHSFENWTPVTIEDPNDWETTNRFTEIGGLGSNVIKSTDAHSGSYAAELTTVGDSQDYIPGIMTNGFIFFGGVDGGVAYEAQPTALECYYKYAPDASDQAFISVTFWGSGGTVIEQQGGTFTANGSYTLMSVPLTVPSIPDSMNITIYSGDSVGSVLHIDDIVFTGGNVGIDDQDLFIQFEMYPNPTNDGFWMNSDLKGKAQYTIVAVDGKTVASGLVNSNKTYINTSNLTPGVYNVIMTSKYARATKKLVVE